MACPIADLARFLTGSWDLQRRIADLRAATDGGMLGAARFTPALDGLRYDERGTLKFGAYTGTAARSYRFALDRTEAAEIRFDDGRPFHRLDLSSGVADVTHACAPDAYRGRYEVSRLDRWTVTWEIDGPRKRMRIVTEYVRRATRPG